MDIYTKDGKLTGRTIERGEDKGPDGFTMGVHAFIYDEKGRFLLQKRAEDKKFRPGQWEITMGHVLAGETAFECVLREVKEELGVVLPAENFVKLYRWVDWESHMHTEIFFVRADLGESALTLQKEEVIGVQWVSKEEMRRFVGNMDYRPENYKAVVASYIRDCVDE